jgi:hypothetical protein
VKIDGKIGKVAKKEISTAYSKINKLLVLVGGAMNPPFVRILHHASLRWYVQAVLLSFLSL